MFEGTGQQGGNPEDVKDPQDDGNQLDGKGTPGPEGAGQDASLKKLQEAIRSRDQAKTRARTVEDMLKGLEKANDGEPLTPDRVAKFQEWEKQQALAELEEAKKAGKFQEILEAKDKALTDLGVKKDTELSELNQRFNRMVVRDIGTELLVSQDLLPEARDIALEMIARGDARIGVRTEAQISETGERSLKLVDMNTGRHPLTDEGKDMTMDEFVLKFKELNPFLFKNNVPAGHGGSEGRTGAGLTSSQVHDVEFLLQPGNLKRYRGNLE